MTVQEYAEKHGLSVKTVYRRIEGGKINAKKVDGIWIIDEPDMISTEIRHKLDTRETYISQLEQQIAQMQAQIEYLQTELSHSNKTLAEERQRHDEQLAEERARHDTIVMSLSNQVAFERKKLEDMRNRKLWTRVKTAFSFAS